MVARAGSPATRSCEPRQARKGAAAAADASAGVQLVRAAAFASSFEAGGSAFFRLLMHELLGTRAQMAATGI